MAHYATFFLAFVDLLDRAGGVYGFFNYTDTYVDIHARFGGDQCADRYPAATHRDHAKRNVYAYSTNQHTDDHVLARLVDSHAARVRDVDSSKCSVCDGDDHADIDANKRANPHCGADTARA